MENKWISVNEKMPQDRVGVLAYIEDEDFMTHCHYEYAINEWMVSDDYRKITSVTHWMELPEPPNRNQVKQLLLYIVVKFIGGNT